MTDPNRFTYQAATSDVQQSRPQNPTNSDVYQYKQDGISQPSFGQQRKPSSNKEISNDLRPGELITQENEALNRGSVASPYRPPSLSPNNNLNVNQNGQNIIRGPTIATSPGTQYYQTSQNSNFQPPSPHYITQQQQITRVSQNPSQIPGSHQIITQTSARTIPETEYRRLQPIQSPGSNQLRVVSHADTFHRTSEVRVQPTTVVRETIIQRYQPPEVHVTRILKEEPRVQVSRESNWGSYYSPYTNQSKDLPPPAAIPEKSKTCCNPIILALLGLLALAGLIFAIVMAANYNPGHGKAEEVSAVSGIMKPDDFTVVEEMTYFNRNSQSGQANGTAPVDVRGKNKTKETSNGTINSGSDTQPLGEGVQPTFEPIPLPTEANKTEIDVNRTRVTYPEIEEEDNSSAAAQKEEKEKAGQEQEVKPIFMNATAIPQKTENQTKSTQKMQKVSTESRIVDNGQTATQTKSPQTTQKPATKIVDNGETAAQTKIQNEQSKAQVTESIPILDQVLNLKKDTVMQTGEETPYVIVRSHKKGIHRLRLTHK